MNKVYLALGSNIGNRENYLKKAASLIEEKVGKIMSYSSIYETQAWNMDGADNFFNQVLLVDSDLEAFELIQAILVIEESLGRLRSNKDGYESRIIDIDILFFNNDIINDALLTVPHPQIENRRFVLEPLAEIAPDYIHPALNKTIKELLSTCKDGHSIAKLVLK